MKHVYNDGGRSVYFTATAVGDCVTRAIAIALDKDYKEVYNAIKSLLGYTPRNGIRKADTKRVMAHFGFVWHATMGIGTGCRTHLKEGEIPPNCVVNLSSHLACVKNNELHDTYDCTRGGSRCVYGYWTK